MAARRPEVRFFDRLRILAAALALSVAVSALAACGGDEEPAPAAPDYETALRDAPPPLAALYDEANELLDGGAPAFEARLDGLRGYPVVVNKWASWCGPCRQEFPWFQSLSAKHGDEVAFLGVNSNDGSETAADFLADYPLPYPSYADPKLEVAAVFDAPTEFPATAFYDSDGELRFVRRGGYGDEAELEADIERHAR
jgi:cytochrome c biogenesis protein CcmG, thiol:disulfide interchange protein DsbE